ncbi:5-bromo-4-chloroindolyl phosphate hydrolysis family protein [Guggenheimella bovis]
METRQTVLSTIVALLVFVLFFALLKWAWWMCIILAVLSYFAFYFLVTPILKIGKINIDDMEDGVELKRLMDEATKEKDFMKSFADKQTDPDLKRRSQELVFTTESILRYLNSHPEKITRARTFLGYYIKTGSSLLQRLGSLQEVGVSTEQIDQLHSGATNALTTLNQLYKKTFNGLVQNEMIDMQADIDLIEEIIGNEGK